jgi:hypothetical protein
VSQSINPPFFAVVSKSLPSKLENILQMTLLPDEIVHARLKGIFKEALICTSWRLLIIKAGFNTGNMFGSNVFQIPYRKITSVDVKLHVLTGYFEVSAAGMQDTAKNYWSVNSARGSPQRSPNCVSIRRRSPRSNESSVDDFRGACTLIMTKMQEGG